MTDKIRIMDVAAFFRVLKREGLRAAICWGCDDLLIPGDLYFSRTTRNRSCRTRRYHYDCAKEKNFF